VTGASRPVERVVSVRPLEFQVENNYLE
jgi:hypothetical protein